MREENKQKRLAAKRAAKEAAATKAKAEDEADADEYYDEEYDAEEEGEEDEEVSGKVADSKDIDPKLRKRYLWLWKEREEMTPEERRWKWVKKENMPTDLIELMDLLSKKKIKTKKEKTDKIKDKDGIEDDEEEVEDHITAVNTRNDLYIDYTQVANVKERLEVLK